MAQTVTNPSPCNRDLRSSNTLLFSFSTRKRTPARNTQRSGSHKDPHNNSPKTDLQNTKEGLHSPIRLSLNLNPRGPTEAKKTSSKSNKKERPNKNKKGILQGSKKGVRGSEGGTKNGQRWVNLARKSTKEIRDFSQTEVPMEG